MTIRERTVGEKDEILVFTVDNSNELTPYGLFGVLLAKKMQEALDKDNSTVKGKYVVNNRGTTGSLSGLIGVENNPYSLALVQADVLHHYINGGHIQFPQKKSKTNIRVISKIFPEWVSIRKKKNNKFKNSDPELTLSDLSGICGGMPGSGKLITSMSIVSLLGVKSESFFKCNEDNSEFDVSSPGEDFLCGTKEYDRVLFMKGTADVISSAYPSLYKSVDPKETDNDKCLDKISVVNFLSGNKVFNKTERGDNKKSVSNKDNKQIRSENKQQIDDKSPYVISVDALLIANKNVPDVVVLGIKDILKALDNKTSYGEKKPTNFLPEFKNLHGNRKWEYCKKNVDKVHLFQNTNYDRYTHEINKYDHRYQEAEEKLNNSYENISVTLHKAIQTEKLDNVSNFIAKIISGYVLYLIMAFTVLAYFVPRFKSYWDCFSNKSEFLQDLGYSFNKNQTLKFAVFAFVFLHAFVVIAIWAGEYQYSENVGGGKSIDGIYGAAKWVLANVIGTTSSFTLNSPLSLLSLGLLKTSYGFSSIVFGYNLVRKKGLFGGVIVDIKKGIAILGQSENFQHISEELNRMYADSQYQILKFNLPLEKNIYQSSDINTYTQADFKSAIKKSFANKRAIILLADKSAAKNNGIDSIDLFTLGQLKKLVDNLDNKKIIVEVLREDSVSLFKSLHSPNAKVIPICVNRFGAELIAQSIEKDALLDIFKELLKTSSNDNEIYYDEVNPELNGKHFFDAKIEGRTPIGILRNDKAFLNPQGNEAFLKLDKGKDKEDRDKLIVIAKRTIKNNPFSR